VKEAFKECMSLAIKTFQKGCGGLEDQQKIILKPKNLKQEVML
jgi:hypothetical protein